MNIISRLHRFIVWDFTTGAPSAPRLSFFIGLIPFVPAALLQSPFNTCETVVLSIAGTLSFGWYSFLAWRLIRMVKAHSMWMDRKYDREGKFKLPQEYALSDSATRAGRRKRQMGLRQGDNSTG